MSLPSEAEMLLEFLFGSTKTDAVADVTYMFSRDDENWLEWEQWSSISEGVAVRKNYIGQTTDFTLEVI